MQKEFLNIQEIRKAALAIRALDHELRRKILRLLKKNTQLTVTELCDRLKIESSVCSGHLGILRKEGIVAASKLGKLRYYSLVLARIYKIDAHCRAIAEK